MIHSKIQNLARQSAAATDQQSSIGNLFLSNIDNLRSTIHYPLATQPMKSTAAFLASLLLAATGAEAKPLRVFILAGQSNMEGHARIETFDYPKKYEAKLISPEEAAKWALGASNAGYHYLGCAKTFALMGKVFADANLAMMKERNGP